MRAPDFVRRASPAWRPNVAPARAEDGFTLIEVVVAAFCLIVVIGAAGLLFGSGESSSLASQRQAQAVALADRYIENIRSTLKTNAAGFSALALKTPPTAASNSTLPSLSSVHTDPNDFVSSASGCGASNLGYQIEANWDSTTEGAAAGLSAWSGCPTGVEPLVVNTASGIISPKQITTVGGAQATVYSYVTDTNVGCTSTTLGNCSTTGTPAGDARRVIVAVVINNGGTQNTGSGANYRIGPNSPVYVSTIFTNPVPSNQPNSTIGLSLGVSVG